MNKVLLGLLTACALTSASIAQAESFVTLGTLGGPMPAADRSQPANALVRDDGGIMLVDAGDGAAEQLAKANLPLPRVDTIFLSHMHFDHTAGVMGILALQYQLGLASKITIYGPPGTEAFINGLLSSMTPFAKAGFGVPGEQRPDPRDRVKIVEITGGSVVTVGNVKVTAVQNTHYSFPPGSELDRNFKSLAFRFDMPDRSIVYTGDTGPSDKVTQLAKGADMLVSEVIDVNKIIEIMRRERPDLSEEQMHHMVVHQETQHLPYVEVGRMAAVAGVKSVVLTHIVPGVVTPEDEIAYRREIETQYHGPVVFAQDLDRF